MKARLLCILTLLVLPFYALAEADEVEQVALGVAQSWLAMVDSGDYEASWNQSSVLFQNTYDKQQWARIAKEIRDPIGTVVERSLRSANYSTSVPNAPEGEYVVILFDSKFSNQKSVTEAIFPMRGEDGKWRVGGYHID